MASLNVDAFAIHVFESKGGGGGRRRKPVILACERCSALLEPRGHNILSQNQSQRNFFKTEQNQITHFYIEKSFENFNEGLNKDNIGFLTHINKILACLIVLKGTSYLTMLEPPNWLIVQYSQQKLRKHRYIT